LYYQHKIRNYPTKWKKLKSTRNPAKDAVAESMVSRRKAENSRKNNPQESKFFKV